MANEEITVLDCFHSILDISVVCVPNCVKCNAQMFMILAKKLGDAYVFRCKICTKTLSKRKVTIFGMWSSYMAIFN